jgi:hypothetical protein
MKKKLAIIAVLSLLILTTIVYITKGNSRIKVLQNTRATQSIKTSNTSTSLVTYKDGLKAVNWAYDGLKFIANKETGVPISFIDKNNVITEFNYEIPLKNNPEYAEIADFNMGLSTINTYMSTGDKKFLDIAENTANLLDTVLPNNGIVPCYKFSTGKNTDDNIIMTGTHGQATILEYVSFLAKINPKYIQLMNKLAVGLINYGINKDNNLAWFKIHSKDGQPVYSTVYGYESQLGSQSVTCAEALLSAYETSPAKENYRQKALDILKAIWKCRDHKTNLICETYDIKNNKTGLKLYPYQYFRYDDMGGVYIRGLSMAYLITEDSEIKDIALTYIPALIQGTWDTTINSGAFRYLSTTDGKSQSSSVELMHGLYVATLLNANEVFYGSTNSSIIEKCVLNAEHTIIDGFSIKNNMSPHLINNDGNYENKNSDSQLGYAVIQYPYGYEKLSQVTGNKKYGEKNNLIIKTLLERHKIGDDVTLPKGFVNIVETTPPFGFEKDYSTPKLMFQEMYLSSYLLYNSIHADKNVRIDWYNGYNPSVFGLVSDMPFWDINNVKFENNELMLAKVTGQGSLDLSDMGFDIVDVKKDNENYNNYKGNIVYTDQGTHKYSIRFK